MKRTTIGDNRKLVTFENPGPPVPDGAGGFSEGWTPLSPATWRVSLNTANARDVERESAGTVLSTASHIARGRWRPDLTTETRMTLATPTGTRVFQITSVQNLEERDRELVLFCEEQVD